jgi:hypothetical protein
MKKTNRFWMCNLTNRRPESQRDSASKPRVASPRATLGFGMCIGSNPNGVAPRRFKALPHSKATASQMHLTRLSEMAGRRRHRESSVRSAMSIATHAEQAAKHRRSGMCSCAVRHFQNSVSVRFYPCRSYGAWLVLDRDRYYKHGAPNGASGTASAEDWPTIVDVV